MVNYYESMAGVMQMAIQQFLGFPAVPSIRPDSRMQWFDRKRLLGGRASPKKIFP
jgi:hypothetical protein